MRLRDFDHDGVCELLTERGIFIWKDDRWEPADFSLPTIAPCWTPRDATTMACARRPQRRRFRGRHPVERPGLRHLHLGWHGQGAARLGARLAAPRRQRPRRHRSPATPKSCPFVKDDQNYGAWSTAIASSGKMRRSTRPTRTPCSAPSRSSSPSTCRRPSRRQIRSRPCNCTPGFTAELVASEPLIESPVASIGTAQAASGSSRCRLPARHGWPRPARRQGQDPHSHQRATSPTHTPRPSRWPALPQWHHTLAQRRHRLVLGPISFRRRS